MSSSFFVIQAQRDLAQARNAELQAILDYNRSLVDFETVQQAPVGGTGAMVSVVSAGGGSGLSTSSGSQQGPSRGGTAGGF
jgi:hypothetical protein